MDFNDWFDVYDINHVRAYEQLQIHGKWPAGFIAEDIQFKDGWTGILHTEFTDAWIEYMQALCS